MTDTRDEREIIDPREMTALELIDRLDALYPHRCARPGESLEAIHRYAGRRQVIDELLAIPAMLDTEDAEVQD